MVAVMEPDVGPTAPNARLIVPHDILRFVRFIVYPKDDDPDALEFVTGVRLGV